MTAWELQLRKNCKKCKHMLSSVRVMSLYNYQKGDKNPPVGPTSIRNSSIGRFHKLYQKNNL
jgi:hypothetical protein